MRIAGSAEMRRLAMRGCEFLKYQNRLLPVGSRSLAFLPVQADRSEVLRVTETQIAIPKARTRSINNQRVIVENGIKHLPSFAEVGLPHKG